MTTPLPSTFGALLRRQRLAAGLTQEALAELAGLSTRGVQDLERGINASPRAETIRLLCEALDLDPTTRAEMIAAARPELQILGSTAAPTLLLPNLPSPPTALVGRSRELADAGAYLRAAAGGDGSRLLTLTGPGGVGKTRLALALAAELRGDFPDSVAWIELASLHDPSLVAVEVAQALGLQPRGEQPPDEAVQAALSTFALLLVLDNMEQVLPAAPFIADLLAAAPRLVVLATSRARLRLRGERELALAPLALPPAGDAVPELDRLANVDAVKLFVERAAEVRSGFTLRPENAAAVVDICRRLDGLPLALELAAAWVKVLPPHSLLDRLERRLPLPAVGARDLPDRQRTMHDTIAWSLDLLTPAEQSGFRRLSVFAGGFTLEAAEAVAVSTNVLDLLTSLIDHSLLRPVEQSDAEPRFSMLETVREAGLERLAASSEAAATQRAHAAFILDMAERADAELGGPEQALWLARLETEHANLRDALEWCMGPDGEIETGLRLGDALWSFWEIRGNLREGRRWLERLLTRAPERTALRARVLTGAGALAFDAGDYQAARVHHDESLSIRREVGDRRGIAVSLGNLGNVAQHQGDYATARELHEECLAIMRELDQPTSVAIVLNNLGQMLLRQGDYAAANAFHQESLTISRELGDTWGIAVSLNNLGELALYQEDYSTAHTLFVEALTLMRELGDTRNVAVALNNLGEVMHGLGDERAARELIEESLALSREVGDQLGIATSLGDLGVVMLDRGDHAAARSFLLESLRIRRDMDDKLGIVRCMAGLAAVACTNEQPERAARLLGASEALLWAMGAVMPPIDRAVAERTVAALQITVGADQLVAAHAAGGAMSIEQAVAEALAP